MGKSVGRDYTGTFRVIVRCIGIEVDKEGNIEYITKEQ